MSKIHTMHVGVMSARGLSPGHATFGRVMRTVSKQRGHGHTVIVGTGGIPQDEKIAHLKAHDPDTNYVPAHPDGVVEHIRQLSKQHRHVHVHVEDETPTEHGPRGGIKKQSTYKDFKAKKWPSNVRIHRSPRLAGVSGSAFRKAAHAKDHEAIKGMVRDVNKAADGLAGKPVSFDWANRAAEKIRRHGVHESKSFAQLREELEQYK